MYHGRAQVVLGGSARETQVRFFTETEAREWATTGKKAADGPNPAALPVQADPVRMQKPPTPDTQPAAAPRGLPRRCLEHMAVMAISSSAGAPIAVSQPSPLPRRR
ncbi:hypothetical protein SHL15_7787 [Streptomyces hygroscopicus subsp. limoneus]|nr:hypothetical protein SHL15_7787 [Streptomyces hygroscopicus subsp. limoneus]